MVFLSFFLQESIHMVQGVPYIWYRESGLRVYVECEGAPKLLGCLGFRV